MVSNNQLKLWCAAFLITETLATVVAYVLAEAMAGGFAGLVAAMLSVGSSIAWSVLQVARRDRLPSIAKGVAVGAAGAVLGAAVIGAAVGAVVVVIAAHIFQLMYVGKFLNKRTSLDESNLDSNSSFLEFSSILLEDFLQSIAPKTWSKTRDSFLDTIEAFPDEVDKWEQRNLKFVAYLTTAIDLAGFCFYFTKTAISTAIAARRVSR